MTDILAIGMLIAGIVALIRGKFQLTKASVVEGVPARIIGVIFLLPLPLQKKFIFLLKLKR